MLLYGSESWVVTREMLKLLYGLHHRASQWTAEIMNQRADDGYLEYPPVDDSMEATGLCRPQ